MSKVNLYILLVFCLLTSINSSAQPRSIIDFNKGWKFSLGNDSSAIDPSFNDSKWRSLDLPHDWSIESNFSKNHPATNQGGALPGGIGWYRKTFVLPASASNKNVSIEFDGVYRNSEVWINGNYLGKWAYGYTAFRHDLSKYIKPAPVKNVIVVKVDNSQQPNSRWYTGSGIYRNVTLLFTGEFSIDKSVFITAPVVTKDFAAIHLSAYIKTTGVHNAVFKGKISLFFADRKSVIIKNFDIGTANGRGRIEEDVKIDKPLLWQPGQANLYTLKLELLNARHVVLDSVTLKTGIRSFYFDDKGGFFVNNRPTKINGVCMHHDLGALGAAFNKAAARRQLKILKEMGCNAIRAAHNPPAAEFLDLCDEMGFLVMDESFDMWQKRKNRYDYHLDFKENYKKDLEAMVLRDRNHPSVFAWSIGNEIREQFDSTGIALTKEMVEVVKALDPTRPVTCALTENIPEKNFIYRSGALDILGFNYKLNDYKDLPSRFPGKAIIATETASALATRGVYDQPSDSMRVWPPDSKQPFTKGNPDMTVSAYDHAFAYWGASHEKALQAVKQHDFIAGCFVWSGFDFLGEPVPYPWPARSSYYGIIDLAGFPKDVYYLYQSEWTNKPVLHIFPHWNWPARQLIDVWAYFNNADEVELYLNDRSLGKRKKENGDMHVMWRVPFTPGTLKAISRKGGKTVLVKQTRTSGKPARIEVVPDRKIIHPDGKDLAFITVRILDKEGNVVPYADNHITFTISGAGRLDGTDNGFQADTSSLKATSVTCWKGMALAIVRSNGKKGNITLRANSAGLLPAVLTLKASD